MPRLSCVAYYLARKLKSNNYAQKHFPGSGIRDRGSKLVYKINEKSTARI